MKKSVLASLAGVLFMASWIGMADASITLEFGSGVGLTHGRLTPVGGITLELGDLELKNFSSMDPLYKAAVDMSDIAIDPNPISTVAGFVMYDAWEKTTISGFALYADIAGDAALETILTGDLHIDYLIVNQSVGAIDTLEIAVDIDNIQLVNSSLWTTVPSILTDLVNIGEADLALNIVASGQIDLNAAIQGSNLVRDIVVSGTVSAVPEPGVLALFAYGLVVAVRFRKQK